jgi:acetolactate synthase-1/2/3 large subunit
MTNAPEQSSNPSVDAHAGQHAVAVARAHGVTAMYTLSGAHVFPMYDGAVTADPPMRIIDVRHEQTAAFAAEATGKLSRTPGLAVLTAGPGVTNGVSAVAQAQFAGDRRPCPGQPLGVGVPPGARPAADPGARVQARAHAAHRR